MSLNTQGKKFAQDFERIDEVKSNDKVLIQDASTGVVKFATPGQINAKFEKLVADITVAETAAAAASTAATKAETAERGVEQIIESATAEAISAATSVAQTAADDAESAKNAAIDAQNGAQNAKTEANTAKVNAQSAQTAAETAKRDAASSASSAATAAREAESARSGAAAAVGAAETLAAAAGTARTGAESAKTAAETAKTAAQSAETNAKSAQSAAETARNEANAAKSGAQTAKNAAETAQAAAEKALTDTRAELPAVKAAIEFLEKALGKYAARTTLALSVGKSGKYVNTVGTEVSDGSFSISAPVHLAAGNIYLFPAATSVGTSVSLFSRAVTRTYDKVINYDFTYGENERVLTATADYDKSLVYTAHYADAEASTPDYWERGGQQFVTLPATHVVTESFYEPLFKTGAASMPASGCYIYLCPVDMDIVISAKTADISNKSMESVRFGVFASITTNFVGAPGQKVLGQAFAQIFAMIAGLAAVVDNGGDHSAISYDAQLGFKVCGFPIIASGHGVPSATTLPEQSGIPAFIGQLYINLDASSNGLYYANGTDAVSNWKQA